MVIHRVFTWLSTPQNYVLCDPCVGARAGPPAGELTPPPPGDSAGFPVGAPTPPDSGPGVLEVRAGESRQGPGEGRRLLGWWVVEWGRTGRKSALAASRRGDREGPRGRRRGHGDRGAEGRFRSKFWGVAKCHSARVGKNRVCTGRNAGGKTLFPPYTHPLLPHTFFPSLPLPCDRAS